MKLESLALHEGYESEPTTKSAAVPIYQTTSYTFDNTQHGADLFDLKVPGNIYTRIMNPTNDVLEKRIAAMGGGIGALCVASGMAAITYALQCICEAGDNIVSSSASSTPTKPPITTPRVVHPLHSSDITSTGKLPDAASAKARLTMKATFCFSNAMPSRIARIASTGRAKHAASTRSTANSGPSSTTRPSASSCVASP